MRPHSMRMKEARPDPTRGGRSLPLGGNTLGGKPASYMLVVLGPQLGPQLKPGTLASLHQASGAKWSQCTVPTLAAIGQKDADFARLSKARNSPLVD